MIKKRKNLFQDHNIKRDLTSLREFSSSQVLKKIWHLQPIIGISRLANLTDFNRLKLPIVSAMRTNVDKAQITSTQGKGSTFREAMCGALMENIERFSASKYEGEFFKDTFSNLKQSAINAINPIDFYYPEKSLEEVQDWISGTHLTTGEHYLIPAAEILFPYHPRQKSSLYIKPHTSSLAAGMSLEEATIHSLIETIERYSTSLFHLEHDDPTLASFIPKKGVKDKECLDLLNQLESIGANIIILEIKSPLPTYFVGLLDSSSLGPPMSVAGTGCSLFPNKALKSALLEAIQGMVVTIQGTREDLKRREEDYKGDFYKEEDGMLSFKKQVRC